MHDLALRMRNGMAKVATGACRSGKSRLLLNLFGDHLRAQGVDGRIRDAAKPAVRPRCTWPCSAGW